MPTDSPIPPGMKLLLGAIGCTLAILWSFIAWRVSRGRPLLPYEPRRSVPWGANDLVLVVLSILLMGIVAMLSIARLKSSWPPDSVAIATYYVGSVAELAGFAMGLVILRIRTDATWTDLGFEPSHLVRDAGIGAVALFASVVPILGLQLLLEKLVDYKQPLIDSLKTWPTTSMLLSTGMAALVAAPIVEEFVCRVLLQGWFESIEARRRALRGIAPIMGPAWWPIVLSALLFASLHCDQGLALVPLFFFAIVLGYVYQRTHRIWPSLVAHLLLNAGSLWMLWNQIQHGGA